MLRLTVWFFAILCALVAAVVAGATAIISFTKYELSAPQECALFAMALAIAVVPYTLARAFERLCELANEKEV